MTSLGKTASQGHHGPVAPRWPNTAVQRHTAVLTRGVISFSPSIKTSPESAIMNAKKGMERGGARERLFHFLCSRCLSSWNF